MVKYPAEEPTLQVLKTRSDKAGPGSQRLSPGANALLGGQQLRERADPGWPLGAARGQPRCS